VVISKEERLHKVWNTKSDLKQWREALLQPPIEALLSKYGAKHHASTPYCPQTSGQMEIFNRKLERILEKMVNNSRKVWAMKLNDAL